jgi:hypothetical protein
MTSFVGMSLFTIVVTLISTWHNTQCTQKERLQRLLREIEDTADSHGKTLKSTPGKPALAPCDFIRREKRHRWQDLSTKLLEYLCDLQLLTGTAIIIAALVQREALSFYHRAIILDYGWLVFNSFWAARQDEYGMWEDSDSPKLGDTRQRHGSSGHVSKP